MADIDNLTIKITADATAAAKSLDKLVESLKAVNDQLDRLDPSRFEAFSKAAKAFNENMKSTSTSARETARAFSDLGKQVGSAAKVGNASVHMSKGLNDVKRAAENASRSLHKATTEAGTGGTSGFGRLASVAKRLTGAITPLAPNLGLFGKVAKGVFSLVTAPAKLATKAIQGLGKANDITTNTAKTLAKELTRVSKMLKLMITRMALRAVIKEVGNGFKSLALHSEEFNQSVSGMMNASKQLGYSFSAMISPLINAFAPAIIYVINLLIKLANIINQVFSSLAGATSWNKAKEFTDNWGKSIEASNKKAKELKKTVLGFDELNQLQEKYTSGGDTSSNIVDMFDTLPIESKWKKVADYIKSIAKRLFDPIKKAWEKVGDFVKDSWKYAMNEVLKLGKSIARDFWEVWGQEKTQQIFENILKIIGWIGVAVGNLAKRFREAWDKNKTGLHILENIRDIILIVTEYIEKMAKATAEWADSLDFSPILTKFNEWLESIKPAVDALMGIVSDFYETVILPLAKWAIEEGGPQLLQVFIDFNEKVKWEQLRERLQKLWEHLEPFAERVGEGLILFIQDCAQALADFINSQDFEDFLTSIEKWMDSVSARDVADALEGICAALLGYKALTFLGGVAASISQLGVAIATIVGIQAGKWLMEVTDPEFARRYEGIAGTFRLIKDLLVAIKDYAEMVGDSFRTLWDNAFGEDTQKSLEDTARAAATVLDLLDSITFLTNPVHGLISRGIKSSLNNALGTDGETYTDIVNQAILAKNKIDDTRKSAEDLRKEFEKMPSGMPTDVWDKISGSTDKATESAQKYSEQIVDTEKDYGVLDSVIKGVIALTNDLGGATTVKVMDFYQKIKDSLKINELKDDLDSGKISVNEFWEAINGLSPSAKAQGSTHLLDNYLKDARKLKDEYEKGTLSTQEYQHELSNLKEKYKSMSDQIQGSFKETSKAIEDSSNNIKGSTTAYDDYYQKSKLVTEKVPMEMAGAGKQLMGVYNEISIGADKNMDEVSRTVNENMSNVKKDTDDTTTAVSTDWQNAQKNLTDAVTAISTSTDKGMTDVSKSVDDSMKKVSESFDTVKKGMTKEQWTFSGVTDGLKKTFSDALDSVKGLWNRFADKMNEGGEIGNERFHIKLPRFAGGGFPENGLFLANSSELVGRFSNGRTAVANNEQIVDGIAAGVYNAVSSAMARSNSGSNGGYIANTIVVDGEVIARTVTKAQERQQMRYSPSMG